jgi:CCR4-NOT transcription complex subunit 1
MRLPDPFTPNLKVDLLPEISQPPRILSDYTTALVPGNLRHDIDVYLKNRGPSSFLVDLKRRLLVDSPDAGVKYNIPVLNALVLYVGVHAIAQAQQKGSPVVASPVGSSPHMDIYQQLSQDLDPEGNNSIAIQEVYFD